MGLVKGFTDILTPVNILPNSDFSRGGGHPLVETFTTIDTSKQQCLERNDSIYAYSGHIYSNVTLTRVNSGGGLTISGTVDTSTGDWTSALRIGLTFNYVQGKTYTCAIDFENNVNCEVNFGFNGGHTNIYYHFEPNRSIRVLAPGASNTLDINIIPSEGTNVQFSVRITLCEVYEGAFCNPPSFKSYDVVSNRLFKLDNVAYSSDAFSNAVWRRLFLLGNKPGGYYLHAYVLTRYYRGYIPALYDLKAFYVIHDDGSLIVNQNGNFITPAIDVIGSLGSSSNYFSKFRFAQESGTNRIFIEGYFSGGTSAKEAMSYKVISYMNSYGYYCEEEICRTDFNKRGDSDTALGNVFQFRLAGTGTFLGS